MDKITIERETLQWAIRWHESRAFKDAGEIKLLIALRAALAAQPAPAAVLAERERCAKVCEEGITPLLGRNRLCSDVPREAEQIGASDEAERCAAAIRKGE